MVMVEFSRATASLDNATSTGPVARDDLTARVTPFADVVRLPSVARPEGLNLVTGEEKTPVIMGLCRISRRSGFVAQEESRIKPPIWPDERT